MVSNRARRRSKIREAMLRAVPRLEDAGRFSTHEIHGIVMSMTPLELAGLGPIKAMMKSIERIDTFSNFVRGHPDFEPHPDGHTNIANWGEGRMRSRMWRLKKD